MSATLPGRPNPEPDVPEPGSNEDGDDESLPPADESDEREHAPGRT